MPKSKKTPKPPDNKDGEELVSLEELAVLDPSASGEAIDGDGDELDDLDED